MGTRGRKKDFAVPSDVFERIMLSIAKSEQKYISTTLADRYMLERHELINRVMDTWTIQEKGSLHSMALSALYQINKLIERLEERC